MADEPEAQVADGQTAGAALAPDSAETPQQTGSPTDETAEPQGSDQPESEAVSPEGEDVISSERGQKRVQQLANERNKAKQEAESLREKLSKDDEEPQQRPQQAIPDWHKPQDPFSQLGGGEITVDQLRSIVITEADRRAQMRVQQQEARRQRVENFDQDVRHLEESYPELKEGIEDTHLGSAIEKAKRNFQVAVRADPNARIRDFIEPIMEARTGGVEQGRDTASAKLAKQQSETAVTPGTSKTKRVSSEEELARMLRDGEITAKEAEKQYPELLGGD